MREVTLFAQQKGSNLVADTYEGLCVLWLDVLRHVERRKEQHPANEDQQDYQRSTKT